MPLGIELSTLTIMRPDASWLAQGRDRKVILVVEDDEPIREAMKEALEEEGPYEVVTACNGKEALELLDGMEHPSLILLDLMMPVMDGAEFLENKRQRGDLEDVPVVVVSAWARDTGPIPGVAELVSKPIQLDALLGTVERYCTVELRRAPGFGRRLLPGEVQQ